MSSDIYGSPYSIRLCEEPLPNLFFVIKQQGINSIFASSSKAQQAMDFTHILVATLI